MEKPNELSPVANMAWSTFGSIVDLGCQWLVSVAVVRLAGSFDDAGVYALASSVYGIVHPVAQYKMYTYHLSDVAYEYSFKDYLGFNALTCFAAFAICLGYSVVTTSLSSVPAILLYALYRLAKVTIDVFHAEDQRNGRMDYIGRSLALQGIASLLAFVAFYYLFNSLCVALFSMVIAVLMIGFIYDCGRTAYFATIEIGISLSKARSLCYKCLPVVLGGIACSLAPALPKQVLQSTVGDAALGIYASVAAPVAIIQMGANYIYYPLLGYFAKYQKCHSTSKFIKLLCIVTFSMAICGLVCVAALNLVGVHLLVLVFGQSIQNYSYLLGPVIISSMITAYMWFLTDLLVSVRGLNMTLFGNALALLAAFCLSRPLISAYGMNGVSYVLIIAYSVSTCYMLIGILRNYL